MIHSPPALFFFKWTPAHVHQFHFLGQDQSTVAQRAKTTVAKCFLMSGMCTCFPWYHSQLTPTLLDQVRVRIGVTCHLHCWQNDQGLLRATAVTQRIRISTESQLWRRKFPPHSCRDSNLQPFNHDSSALPKSYPSSGYVHFSPLTNWIWGGGDDSAEIYASAKRCSIKWNIWDLVGLEYAALCSK